MRGLEAPVALKRAALLRAGSSAPQAARSRYVNRERLDARPASKAGFAGVQADREMVIACSCAGTWLHVPERRLDDGGRHE